MGERLPYKQGVTGSKPVEPTNKMDKCDSDYSFYRNLPDESECPENFSKKHRWEGYWFSSKPERLNKQFCMDCDAERDRPN